MAPPPLSLYVHLPWCVRKCPYCDFNSYPGGDDVTRLRYLDALCRDLASEAARAGDRPLVSIFLGGGTPSLFRAEEIARLLDVSRSHFAWADGIEVTMEKGVVKVVAPIDDTPAANAGILANDLITHLDNKSIVGLTLTEAVERMRGPVNTEITLTVVRDGVEDPLDIKIKRAVIRINAVKSRAEADGEIGYIKVTTFNEKTHANLVKAVQKLEKEHAGKLKGYIVDLRNNPGGLLDQSRDLADLASREEALAVAGSKRPIGRLAEVDEIAGAIAFLCSERASYVSGAAWSVDGGTVQVII